MGPASVFGLLASLVIHVDPPDLAFTSYYLMSFDLVLFVNRYF